MWRRGTLCTEERTALDVPALRFGFDGDWRAHRPRAATAIAQVMRTLLFGVSPLDPLSFAVVPLILVLAAALASFLPASRATAVNPVDALKAE
jgi:hypothetical protein